MKLSDAWSREHVMNGLKNVGKLRVKISHSALITLSAMILILFIAFTIRILPLRWEIQVGSVHLSEFDPYFHFSLVQKMTSEGLFSPYYPSFWVDYKRWAPYGINMASSYPSLPWTAAFLYEAVSALGINIDPMTFCAFIPVFMGTLAVVVIFFLGKDIGGRPVGLLAALFLALSPSFIQRTSLGFFDTENVGILGLLVFSLLFLRALDEDRSMNATFAYSIGAAAGLIYFILGWGAAYYPIGLAVLFVFALILMRRYSRRLLLTYSVTFGLALLVSIMHPYITTSYLTSFAVLPVVGIFVLLFLNEIVPNLASSRARTVFAITLLIALIGGFIVLWQLGFVQSLGGKFISVLDPLSRAGSPIVESVAEHRISSWGSMYYDFGITIVFFAASLYFLVRNLTNRNLFLLLFGLTALYFASSMVRLLLILAPALSLLAAVGIVGVLKPFSTLLKEPPRILSKKRLGLPHVGKEFSGVAVFLIFLMLMINFAFAPQYGGTPRVYKQVDSPVTISAGSLPIVTAQPVDEWLNLLAWTRSNLPGTTVVCSWWDYGYWLTLVGNMTTLADNATINTTQIQNVGFTFMANETASLKMLKLYNAKYILVFTTVTFDSNSAGIFAGYGDEGKWMWMARISGQARGDFINKYGFLDENSAWEDENFFGKVNENTSKWEWNAVGMNTTIYKLMSYGKYRYTFDLGITDGDQQYNAPQYFKEAYFSGISDEPGKYGGIVPLVLLYEIEYPPD